MTPGHTGHSLTAENDGSKEPPTAAASFMQAIQLARDAHSSRMRVVSTLSQPAQSTPKAEDAESSRFTAVKTQTPTLMNYPSPTMQFIQALQKATADDLGKWTIEPSSNSSPSSMPVQSAQKIYNGKSSHLASISSISPSLRFLQVTQTTRSRFADSMSPLGSPSPLSRSIQNNQIPNDGESNTMAPIATSLKVIQPSLPSTIGSHNHVRQISSLLSDSPTTAGSPQKQPQSRLKANAAPFIPSLVASFVDSDYFNFSPGPSDQAESQMFNMLNSNWGFPLPKFSLNSYQNSMLHTMQESNYFQGSRHLQGINPQLRKSKAKPNRKVNNFSIQPTQHFFRPTTTQHLEREDMSKKDILINSQGIVRNCVLVVVRNGPSLGRIPAEPRRSFHRIFAPEVYDFTKDFLSMTKEDKRAFLKENYVSVRINITYDSIEKEEVDFDIKDNSGDVKKKTKNKNKKRVRASKTTKQSRLDTTTATIVEAKGLGHVAQEGALSTAKFHSGPPNRGNETTLHEGANFPFDPRLKDSASLSQPEPRGNVIEIIASLGEDFRQLCLHLTVVLVFPETEQGHSQSYAPFIGTSHAAGVLRPLPENPNLQTVSHKFLQEFVQYLNGFPSLQEVNILMVIPPSQRMPLNLTQLFHVLPFYDLHFTDWDILFRQGNVTDPVSVTDNEWAMKQLEKKRAEIISAANKQEEMESKSGKKAKGKKAATQNSEPEEPVVIRYSEFQGFRPPPSGVAGPSCYINTSAPPSQGFQTPQAGHHSTAPVTLSSSISVLETSSKAFAAREKKRRQRNKKKKNAETIGSGA